MKHEPQLYRTARLGWCYCICGWRSGTYTTTVGAHLAFGRHLLAQTQESSDEQ